MSLVKLVPFCIGKSIPSEASQKFLDLRIFGSREKKLTKKKKLYEHLCTLLELYPQWKLLRNESKGMTPPCTRFALWWEIPANYNRCGARLGGPKSKAVNSLTAKFVPAGTKLALFGRYALNIYIGIVQYILRKTKTRHDKIYLATQCTNRWISYDIN